MSGAPHKMASVPFVLCGFLLLSSLLTGGGTHSGFLGDVITQLLAIPLLMSALWPAFEKDGARNQATRLALVVCAIVFAIVFIQLMPLPVSVWSDRSDAILQGSVSHLAGVPTWNRLSLTPDATWSAALSLLVPLAIFSAVMQLNHQQKMMLCWLVLGFSGVSLLLGLLQMAGGPQSPLRFYAYTNPTEPVGFFANRNHYAALLNVALILSGLWLAKTLEGALDRQRFQSFSFVSFAAAFTFFVAIVTGLVMARSRAGVVLAMIALAGIVVMIVRHTRMGRASDEGGQTSKTRGVSVLIAVFALLFALQVGLGRLLDRFEANTADDLRWQLSATTLATAYKALPFGTGLGSFVPVYASVEKTNDTVTSFGNRAHNDFAEFFLETGLLGAAVLVAFLVWFGRRIFIIWIRPQPEASTHQVLLHYASSMIILLILLHSLVDYPVRTTALAAIFGLFCGILAAPLSPVRAERPRPGLRILRSKMK